MKPNLRQLSPFLLLLLLSSCDLETRVIVVTAESALGAAAPPVALFFALVAIDNAQTESRNANYTPTETYTPTPPSHAEVPVQIKLGEEGTWDCIQSILTSREWQNEFPPEDYYLCKFHHPHGLPDVFMASELDHREQWWSADGVCTDKRECTDICNHMVGVSESFSSVHKMSEIPSECTPFYGYALRAYQGR